MIVYDLICAHRHRFEGWFASAEDFARQREQTLIHCPLCDDADIERCLSANVQIGRAAEPSSEQPKEPASATQAKETTTLAAVDAHALKLIRHLIAQTENVGRAFPEEARKIHYDEAPKRSIRGQATSEEADALREEGIDFMSLPSFLTSDLN
jgi:hypothetical protein